MTLSVRNIHVRYGAKCVLDDVSLHVALGDWFALIGPNGSGKTTLLRCISGQITPNRGTVHIGGHSMLEAPERARRLLGYAHPPERLPDRLTGLQCLQIYAGAYDLPAIGATTLALAEELRLTAALDQTVATYSLGMRQKLCFLLALTADPALIVLDETFNGLDPRAALILKNALRARTREGRSAVVLATHSLDVVLRDATRAALLLDGAFARTWDRGELDAMRGDPGSLEQALSDATNATAIAATNS
jgi:ABC-2 type transport system ATP-binding protein